MTKSVGSGVKEKLRRAHMHREDLERRVTRFTRTGAYTVDRNDDIKPGKSLWVVEVHKRPPLIRWGARHVCSAWRCPPRRQAAKRAAQSRIGRRSGGMFGAAIRAAKHCHAGRPEEEGMRR